MKKEIEILGGGVSGLTAAIILSKNGFKVKVYERENKIGKKHNHISAVRNYEKKDWLEKIKKMGLDLIPSKTIKTVIRHSPSGFISKTLSERPIFYMFNRGMRKKSLEKQLLEQALKNNVEIIYNSNKDKATIIATGVKKANIFACGKIYKGKIDCVHLFYNNIYAPKGYLCILPSKDEFEVLAVGFDKNEFLTLEKKFEDAIKKDDILMNVIKNCEVIEEVKGYGNYFNPIGYKNGYYYVGEAGGFQDASRGFGIWYAILTGYLAALSIVKKTDYNKKWQNLLSKEVKENIKRRKMFNQLSNKDFDIMVKKMGKKISLEGYIKKRKA
jgi:flavin-dependent dehydrogenase